MEEGEEKGKRAEEEGKQGRQFYQIAVLSTSKIMVKFCGKEQEGKKEGEKGRKIKKERNKINKNK